MRILPESREALPDAEVPYGLINLDDSRLARALAAWGLIYADFVLITAKTRDPQRGGTRVRTPALMPLDCVMRKNIVAFATGEICRCRFFGEIRRVEICSEICGDCQRYCDGEYICMIITV